MCSKSIKELAEDTFDEQGISTDILDDMDNKDTMWYSRVWEVSSLKASLIPDDLREVVLAGFMQKMMKYLSLEADEWNKVCVLFDTYCSLAPEVVIPEMVPSICVTLCHIMWKAHSVNNRSTTFFCAGAVENMGRWIVQQGYAGDIAPVTKPTVIQLESNILRTLRWHLDPPTITSAAKIILHRFIVLTKGLLGSNAEISDTTEKYVRKIIMSKARHHYPTVKLARGAVALSLASARLLPVQGRASIVPESAQNAWNDICKAAFVSETFLEDMVEVGRFLDNGRWTTTS